MLEELGIDINAAINGVWVPNTPEVLNPDGTTTHNQTFRDSYFEYLEEKFDGVDSRDEALDILDEIKEGLQSGELQFGLKPKVDSPDLGFSSYSNRSILDHQ